MSTGSQAECPLCMDPLELDDINFFPCTCGYQVCRFCWHRIRTDENGLCPACRRSYTEDPAQFKPLAGTDLQKIKKEKRQKESQKKQKAEENRKHLTNVRVVQKNLVFVVGLTQRLADVEVLKKHEYFGKFGKIHKIVINQSTSYAGSQGPSASAYVTYYKSDDAIRAIQIVNNLQVDGRTIKASLGTTKYCSYYLRSLSCLKTECMYLHEPGDEQASFTKEQMQQGKHVEYEQMLYDTFNENTRSAQTSSNAQTSSSSNEQTSSGTTLTENVHLNHSISSNTDSCNNSKKSTKSANSSRSKKTGSSAANPASKHANVTQLPCNQRSCSSVVPIHSNNRSASRRTSGKPSAETESSLAASNNVRLTKQKTSVQNCALPHSKSSSPDDNRCLTSSETQKLLKNACLSSDALTDTTSPSSLSSSISSTNGESQETAPEVCNQDEEPRSKDGGGGGGGMNGDLFGLRLHPGLDLLMNGSSSSLFHSSNNNHHFCYSNKIDTHEDDLGFDPWHESTKGLADMMEKENNFFNSEFLSEGSRPNNGKITTQQMETKYIGCQTIPTENKTLSLKQVPSINKQNSRPSNNCMLRSNGSITTIENEWSNGLRAVLPKSNVGRGGGGGIIVPQIDNHLVTAGNHQPIQQLMQNRENDVESYIRHSTPEDLLWQNHNPNRSHMTSHLQIDAPTIHSNRSWMTMTSLNDFCDGLNGFHRDSAHLQYGRPSFDSSWFSSSAKHHNNPIHLVSPPHALFSQTQFSSHLEGHSTLSDGVD